MSPKEISIFQEYIDKLVTEILEISDSVKLRNGFSPYVCPLCRPIGQEAFPCKEELVAHMAKLYRVNAEDGVAPRQKGQAERVCLQEM